ncbi:MAG: archease [Candidatus Latescibacterota bacterium]|nr:MAG: archease [Candidatus Latescibacterota bacterium]
MRPGFEEFDHAGDIGIEAWGQDMSELIENATLGLLGLFCRGGVEPRTERQLGVESSTREDLLVDWLAEVITAVGANGEIYSGVEITRVGEHFAYGILRGEKVDTARHDLRFDVKAATYHGLMVGQTADGLRGRIIFDL